MKKLLLLLALFPSVAFGATSTIPWFTTNLTGIFPSRINGTVTRVGLAGSTTPHAYLSSDMPADRPAVYIASSSVSSSTGLYIANDGKTVIGSNYIPTSIGGLGSMLSVSRNTPTGFGIFSEYFNIGLERSGGSVGPALAFSGSNGTLANKTVSINNDILGRIAYFGYDGSTGVVNALIDVDVSGTVSSGIVPAAITFDTMDAAGATAERFRIGPSYVLVTSDSRLGISSSSPISKLTIGGDGTAVGGIAFDIQPNAGEKIWWAYNDGNNFHWTAQGGGTGMGIEFDSESGAPAFRWDAQTGQLDLGGATATHTSPLGWNITGGCYAKNSVCIGGSNFTGTGFAGMMASWVDATTLRATSTIIGSHFIATSTAATSTFAGDFKLGNGKQQPWSTFVGGHSTSTWTGTTTVNMGPAMANLTVEGVRCYATTGTVGASLYDGSNRADYIPTASSTANFNNYTTNNTFTAGEQMLLDLGTPASSPVKVTCRFRFIYTF